MLKKLMGCPSCGGMYWQRRASINYIIEYDGQKYQIADLALSDKIGRSERKSQLIENSEKVIFNIQRRVGEKDPVKLFLENFLDNNYNVIGYLLKQGELEEFRERS
jgi:hypothetical protein